MGQLTDLEKKLLSLIEDTISYRIYYLEDGAKEKDKLAYSTCLSEKEKIKYTKQSIKQLQESFKNCNPAVASFITAFINVHPSENLSYDERKSTIIQNFFLSEFTEILEFLVSLAPDNIDDAINIDLDHYINHLGFNIAILEDFIIQFANAERYIGLTSILESINNAAPETFSKLNDHVEVFKKLAEETTIQVVKVKLNSILTPKSDVKAIDSAIDKIHTEFYHKFNTLRSAIIVKLDILKTKSQAEYIKGIICVYDSFIKLYYNDRYNCEDTFSNMHEDRQKHTDFYCILGLNVLMRKIIKEIVDEILIERTSDFDKAYNLPSSFKDTQNYINKGLYEMELLMDGKIKKASYYNIPRAIEKFNSVRFKYENNPIQSYSQLDNYYTAINILYNKIDQGDFENEKTHDDGAFTAMWDQLCFFASDILLLFTQSEIDESEPKNPKMMELLGEGITETKVEIPTPVINTEKTKHKSFTYTKKGASNQSKITDFRKDLIDAGFIDKSTKLADFNKVFKNELPTEPIKWLGNVSELCYLIRQMHNEKEVVVNTDKEVWKITAKCFIQADGTCYDWSKLRGQKPPANTKKLDNIISNL
jgi:hypothetical protein